MKERREGAALAEPSPDDPVFISGEVMSKTICTRRLFITKATNSEQGTRNSAPPSATTTWYGTPSQLGFGDCQFRSPDYNLRLFCRLHKRLVALGSRHLRLERSAFPLDLLVALLAAGWRGDQHRVLDQRLCAIKKVSQVSVAFLFVDHSLKLQHQLLTFLPVRAEVTDGGT